MSEIVLTTPIIRSVTMPKNEKQHDALLNKVDWNAEEVALLSTILDSYIEE